MKTVFKSSELAHVWAHQSAPEGRCSAHISFQGVVFYSYGTEMARHITHKGRRAIIYNETPYSITTSRHQSRIRCAIHKGIPVFLIGDIGMGRGLSEIGGKELFTYAVEQSTECAQKASKAHKRKDQWLSKQAQWLERAKAVNEFFGLRRKVDEGTIERLREASAKAEREERARKAKRDAQNRLEQMEAFECWKANIPTSGPISVFNANLFPVAFRIEGVEVVSTLGARVPLADAKIALRFALAHREGGWTRNGEMHRVGHYQLDSVDSKGVHAGCHHIGWAEIERLQTIL